MNEKNALLRTLSALAFSMFDLHLFLNTHPDDAGALAMYSQYQQKYLAAAAEFERKYGPLTAMNGISDNQWKWIRSPWPWEYGFNA